MKIQVAGSLSKNSVDKFNFLKKLLETSSVRDEMHQDDKMSRLTAVLQKNNLESQYSLKRLNKVTSGPDEEDIFTSNTLRKTISKI
ncbi:hypothetical protein NQ317_007069 [Molorchus minor]|uniref:Uncharacterized protein n=1 Tax=Molorchus minor TaxID=1323400 RepID=A0ABQ9K6X3_9CUCU|nr:hypothetical protein NQ317_007069 [Molorchus minor]